MIAPDPLPIFTWGKIGIDARRHKSHHCDVNGFVFRYPEDEGKEGMRCDASASNPRLPPQL
jgi:hypothetical protein